MAALFIDRFEIVPADVNHGKCREHGARAGLYANCLVSMRISD